MKNGRNLNSENTEKEPEVIHGQSKKETAGAVEAYLQIRPEILKNLEGYFESDELKVIVNVLSECNIKPTTSAHGEVASLIVGSKPIGSSSLYTVAEKIEGLSGAQLYFLMEEIFRLKREGKGYLNFINYFRNR